MEDTNLVLQKVKLENGEVLVISGWLDTYVFYKDNRSKDEWQPKPASFLFDIKYGNIDPSKITGRVF